MTRLSEVVNIYGKEVHEWVQHPTEEEMKDCILEDLQPIRLGLNGRAIMVKFGKFEQKVYGYTKSDLYIKCIVDQLRRDPYNHIHKIKFRRTKYAG